MRFLLKKSNTHTQKTNHFYKNNRHIPRLYTKTSTKSILFRLVPLRRNRNITPQQKPLLWKI